MSKFKPDQMVMLKGCGVPSNNGKIVTLVKFIGTPPVDRRYMDFWRHEGTWWQVDQKLGCTRCPPQPFAAEVYMVPLSDPDLGNEILKEKLDESRKSSSRIPASPHHAGVSGGSEPLVQRALSTMHSE